MIEITGEIPAELFESYREHAMGHIGAEMELPGFRKGHIPANILESKIPEMHILEEMAEHAIGEHYPKMLAELEIDAIGRPTIGITKVAKGNPLGFTITTALFPTVTLPDYKKIAKDTKAGAAVEVTDEDLEKFIHDIRASRVPAKTDAEGKRIAPEESELPVLDDAFVKSVGNFETVEDFKKKVRENMQLERQNGAHEKHRLAIMEAILDGTKTDIPELLIEAELDKMLYRMKSDITGMGLPYEDYLKHLGKTEDVLRGEFRADAEKRVRLELALAEISKLEKITPKDEDITREVAKLMDEYKEADQNRVTAYVIQILTNEAVFSFLESLSK